MEESKLSKNIVRYRKERGLSQEKVSEYMGVSRQAVTKWENDLSRPCSEHLIRLAELLEVSVDTLLGNGEEAAPSVQTKIATGKIPWILMGISASCMLTYMVNSIIWGIFSAGVLVCMFMICVPVQMFLHILFSNAVKNDSINGIAGFDDKTEYNICEVKKLLVQMDLQIGILSAVFVFLPCVVNCMDFGTGWFNSFLVVLYAVNLVAVVEFSNYKWIDRIYLRDVDKKRARRGMPVTVVYTALVIIGICITYVIFEAKGIENNTWTAIKAGGILLLGILAATTGFIAEHSRIKKWDPAGAGYRTGWVSIICLSACVMLYVIMCIVERGKG